jgi:hypothetical protein
MAADRKSWYVDGMLMNMGNKFKDIVQWCWISMEELHIDRKRVIVEARLRDTLECQNEIKVPVNASLRSDSY